MSVWKDIQKNIKGHHVIAFFGLILVVWAIGQYSMNKGGLSESMEGSVAGGVLGAGGSFEANKAYLQKQAAEAAVGETTGNGAGVQPAGPLGTNETAAAVHGVGTNTHGLPPSCSRQPVANPAELLPQDTNSQWAELNPTGNGDLKNVNLLKAGYHVGIDTVGNTLRNANLQVRSEPANPQLNVGPWNNTTISPDTMRVPLEVGQGAQ